MGLLEPDPTSVRVAWARTVPAHVALPVLSAAERGRLARTRSAPARDRFASGRALARLLVAEVLGCSAREVPLALPPGASRGRPSVTGSTLDLSITHSAGLAVVAVHPTGRVGVDAERVRRVTAGLAARVLSLAEAARHEDPGAPLDDAGLLTYWCRKEAVLKCAGTGHAVRMTTLTVSAPGHRATLLDAGAPAVAGPLGQPDVALPGSALPDPTSRGLAVHDLTPRGLAVHDLTLHDVPLPPGFRGALALTGGPCAPVAPVRVDLRSAAGPAAAQGWSQEVHRQRPEVAQVPG
ncbi:4'-phosphopantetheinyl transferase family protein [Cellulomonas sp. NPDC055163]